MSDHLGAEFSVGHRIQTTKGGAYDIQRLLGIGGMGEVYQVASEEEMGGGQFALKMILRDLAMSRSNVDRFETEGRFLCRFRHENIIRIHNILYVADTEPRRPLILMELLQGFTLRHLIDQQPGPFPLLDICTIAIGVSNALAYIHDQNIVHRDVKSDNIYIDRSHGKSRVVLLDFGIMKNILQKPTAQKNKFNTSGHFVGTYATASPEQLLGQEVTPRSDLYSLATVLYEMITRTPIFPDLTEARAIGQAHLDRRPVPLHELVPQIPREILDIIMQALEKDPAKRPENAYLFLAPFTTQWQKMFVEKALAGSNSTIQKLLTNTVGAEHWSGGQAAPTAAASGGTVRMVALQPRVDVATTAPCGPPEGGTDPGPRVDRVNPPARSELDGSASVGSSNSAAPLTGHPAVLQPRPHGAAGAPSGMAMREASPNAAYAQAITPPQARFGAARGMDDVPIVAPVGLPTPFGTDPTSARTLGKQRLPEVAETEPIELPVQRGWGLIGSIAIGCLLGLGGFFLIARTPAHAPASAGEPPAASSPAPTVVATAVPAIQALPPEPVSEEPAHPAPATLPAPSESSAAPRVAVGNPPTATSKPSMPHHARPSSPTSPRPPASAPSSDAHTDLFQDLDSK